MLSNDPPVTHERTTTSTQLIHFVKYEIRVFWFTALWLKIRRRGGKKGKGGTIPGGCGGGGGGGTRGGSLLFTGRRASCNTGTVEHVTPSVFISFTGWSALCQLSRKMRAFFFHPLLTILLWNNYYYY